MKTLLEMKLDELASKTTCPVCGASRMHWFPANDRVTMIRVLNPDDKAGSTFECGAEYSINDEDNIISRNPCWNASQNAAAEMDQEAYYGFAQQEAV